jgi:hypothetical protein
LKNIKLSKIHFQQLNDKTINEDKIYQKINELEKEMKDLQLSQKLKQNHEPKLYYQSNLNQTSSLP